MAGNWLTNLFNRTVAIDPSGSSAGTYDGFAGGGTYGGFSVGAAPLAQDAPYYVDHTNVAVAQSGAGGSTTGLQSEFGPASASGNAFVATTPTDDLIAKNHAIAVNLENQQSERLAAEIKVNPTVIDPADIISNSQRQTFKDLGIVDSNTSTSSSSDQYAITHKMAQMDNTDSEIVGGGTSNLTSTQRDALVDKNHAIAVEQENILASKLATEKKYTDIKQAAQDESLDIVSNANKDNFLNGTTSVSPSEINNGRVGENGGKGIVSSATDYHSALHDSFTLPAGTSLDSPIPPIMVDNGVGRGQGTIPRFNRGD